MAHNAQATRGEKVLLAMKPLNTARTMWTGRVDGVTYDVWLSTTNGDDGVWAVNGLRPTDIRRRHLGTFQTRNQAFQAIIADK